jgi:3-carboxy-cis,cis-muconate cycloisomerase
VSALWDPVFGATAVGAELDDRAWLRALCDAEAALAHACAAAGVIDPAAAAEVAVACAQASGTDIQATGGSRPAAIDPAELGRLAADGGNPVIPLVRLLRERAPAAAVHRGATSQDILDTAAMLVAHRALGVVLADLTGAADAAAGLAARHRDTPMAGRTLLQQAVPTTFGAVAAGWGAGLDRAAGWLARVRAGTLAVQLGGAAGTLAALHPHGPAVLAAFAERTGLAEPDGVWHTERTRVAELAGALGAACGAAGKAATDVVLLAQTELGEVREAAGGGSSSMPHKHNPVAAVTARAAAAQAPGLVATLLAAMPGELQRGAGPWHAEWEPLTALLRATGGAAARLRDCLGGLVVDAAAMARNVAAGPAAGGDPGHAPDLVDRYLTRRPR